MTRKPLAVLAHFDLPYVGMIGNATRAEQILATLATHNGSRRGIKASFYYPAGLDIGAQTPEEIALSLVAEIQAVLSARQGSSLKHKKSSGSRLMKARLLAVAGADRR